MDAEMVLVLLPPCLPLASGRNAAGELVFSIRQKGLMYSHVQTLLPGVLLSFRGVAPS